MGIRRMGVKFVEESKEWRFPDLLYAEYLALCSEPKEDLKVMVGRFVEVYMTRGLKVKGK